MTKNPSIDRSFILRKVPKGSTDFEICEKFGSKFNQTLWWNNDVSSCDYVVLPKGKYRIIGVATGKKKDTIIIKKIKP